MIAAGGHSPYDITKNIPICIKGADTIGVPAPRISCNGYYSAVCSLSRRIISIALFGMRVPGPKMAATPAL